MTNQDQGEAKLSQGVDFYKPTMAQVQYEKYPEAEVTFTLKNRRAEELLSTFVPVEQLEQRLAAYQDGWRRDEVNYLLTQERAEGGALFTAEYADFLTENSLPSLQIGSTENGELAVSTTGKWPLVTFWETVVMSEINEIYFENKIKAEGLNIEDVYNEGDKRLSDKIALLHSRPDIKFADFGTRRRFSYKWQRHVVERLVRECPNNLIGTSNVALAEEFDLMPIGTYAHEMPMVYAALAEAAGESPLSSHSQMLVDWQDTYNDNLSTALTDTFTSDFFFADMSPEQAESWRALRHDSGDPITFGQQVLDFYHDQNIDPKTKTIVFSDGLDINKIIELADYFKGKINVVYGWGTTLTNDLGLPTNNIVMKATCVNGQETVKISDDSGKYTGPSEKVEKYISEAQQIIGRVAVAA